MVALPTTHLLSDALSLVRAMAADAAVSSLLRRFRFREATRLQQWFEYCPNLKKRSCPVCKQACTNASVGRLYFQSVGDSNDCISQKPRSCEQTPEELQNEVNRLEGKVAGLSSSLERQQKDFKEVKDELLKCSEQLKTEVALKVEAQISDINQSAVASREI